ARRAHALLPADHEPRPRPGEPAAGPASHRVPLSRARPPAGRLFGRGVRSNRARRRGARLVVRDDAALRAAGQDRARLLLLAARMAAGRCPGRSRASRGRRLNGFMTRMDARRALVSVVIPCWNQEDYVAEAVHSARARNFAVEIVVVDDGSTDRSGDAAARAGATVIRQENQGVAAARNRGFAASHGGLVIFLDADDKLLPGAIDAAAGALLAHPDCAMAYGRCVMMGPDG